MLSRLRLSVLTYLLCVIFPSLEAVARPSKIEKAQRRAAFWGLFSDLYRASSCLGFKSPDYECAKRTLIDAAKHSLLVDQATGQESSGFQKKISSMTKLVEANNSADALKEIKSALKEMMSEFAEASAPVVQPTKDLGKKIYDQYCASCHGDGRGVPGSLAAKLKSIPPVFNRSDRHETQFPFGIYAVMIHGTDDGEMASFLDVLSVDELWAAAFYVTSLPFPEASSSNDELLANKINQHADSFALSALAMSTDADLIKIIKDRSIDCRECVQEVAYLRSEWPWSGVTGRLSTEAKAPRDSSEARALVILLVSLIAVSAGFIFILRRSGRIERD